MESSINKMQQDNLNSVPFESWKQEMLQSFSQWLDELSQANSEPEYCEHQEQPDLFTFFSTLNALQTEIKKSNRKTAESLANLGETLGNIQNSMQHTMQPAQGNHTLQIISLTDRINRIQKQLKDTPPPRILFNVNNSKKYHKTITDAIDLLSANASDLLQKMRLQKTPTVGKLFDPQTMVAIEVENTTSLADNQVTEEFSAGYTLDGVVIRLAEVKVARYRN